MPIHRRTLVIGGALLHAATADLVPVPRLVCEKTTRS